MEKHRARLQAAGEPVDSKAMDDFYRKNFKVTAVAFDKLTTATTEIQRLSPLAQYIVLPFLALNDSVRAVYGSPDSIPWDYDGDYANAKQVASECSDTNPQQWEEISFGKSVHAETIRNGAWNANASYGGSFFSVGGDGGGDEYSRVVTADSESVSLRFCNLTYLDIGPGDWFSMDLLERLNRGELKLKKGSKVIKPGRPILGPGGYIPRLVSGLIVARRIVFEAKLDNTKLEEMRKSIAGNAGISIGPFHIGGSGSRSEYSKVEASEHGLYRLGTGYTVPVILAVVTESTTSK